MVPAVSHQITTFISTNSRSTLAASAFNGVVALEMAARVIKNLGEKWKGSNDSNVDWNLSANLGGTIFYGLLAANIIPGTSKLGALTFTIYSLYQKGEENAYLSTKAINWIVTKTANHLLLPVLEHVVAPLCEHLLLPLIDKVFRVIGTILSAIPLPKTPIWWGVSSLVGAIALYKFGVPSVSSIGNRLQTWGNTGVEWVRGLLPSQS